MIFASFEQLPPRMRYTRGTLDPRWSVWFDPLAISHDGAGNTVLAGIVLDQAALYGLINRLRDLGLTLLTVAREGCRQESGVRSQESEA